MDLFQIEEYRRNLIHFINSDTSDNQKILLINEFCTILFENNDEIIAKAYLPEFTGEMVKSLEEYTPLYKDPELSRKILQNLKLIIDSGIDTGDNTLNTYYRLRNEFIDYEKIFINNSHNNTARKKISFPIIELFHSIGQRKLFGFIEHIEVEVFDAANDDTFIIVPSEQDIDKRLNEQIKTSWQLALSFVKKYVRKVNKYHKVIIQFESRRGFYIGDSLGTALTVMFVKKLLFFYNSPYLIDMSDDISMTGGMDNRGNIISVSDIIVEKKVETVFYSPVNIFVVPEKDKKAAEESLKVLEKKYPDRDRLRITGVKDLHDLFDRRSIIEVRKQNPVIRSSKFVKKNWFPALLLTMLAVIFALLILSDLDNNPVLLTHEGYLVKVLNRNGKLLWSKNVNTHSDDNLSIKKLVDINQDGINEVLLTSVSTRFTIQDVYTLYCFDNKKEVLWKYRFTDSVSTELEAHSSTYPLLIIDTLTINNKNLLYLIANNNPFYPAAIFPLDLLTGERTKDIFWHSGHITDCIIDDFNNDGKKEIAAIGLNNCFEGLIFFTIDIDKLTGQGPAEGNYVFKNIPQAKINKYTMLPKTDYCAYNNLRFPSPWNFSYDSHNKEFTIISREGLNGALLYIFDKNLNVKRVNCDDDYEVYRDELVEKGELSPPLTNTSEYFGMLKNDTRYWNGFEFKTAASGSKK